jgi:hypothetical protein
MEYLLLVVVVATLLALGAAYGSLAATMYVMRRSVAPARGLNDPNGRTARTIRTAD